MKALLIAASMLLAPLAYAGDSYEVCTDAGLCALRVTDTDTGNDVWLVTEAGYELSYIWGGTYWIVDQPTYDEVQALIPERVFLPAVNPTTGITMERAKGGKSGGQKGGTSGGTSGGSQSGGSLITVGNITVGGGNSGCTDCHKGSMREIHKMDAGSSTRKD